MFLRAQKFECPVKFGETFCVGWALFIFWGQETQHIPEQHKAVIFTTEFAMALLLTSIGTNEHLGTTHQYKFQCP
jgi:hypothetical protein